MEAHPGAIDTCPGAMEALRGGWTLIMNKLHENPTSENILLLMI
jgi:hypothetical protein